MATVTIDTGELEYLRSCGDKLQGIAEVVKEGRGKDKKISAEAKLQKIREIIKS